jgi:hypothetical protein
MFAFLIISAFAGQTVAAQITIKLPKIKIEKPDAEKPRTKDTTNPVTTNQTTTSNSKHIYEDQRPTNVPVFLKNSLYIQAKAHDEYWKMKGQKNYSSWIPQIRFSHFYNHEKSLKYTVEYFNPDGSLWYDETLEESGRNADRTVLYKSPSPYGNGVLDTKTTDKAGVFGFKITDQETKAVLFQGKFKVGKFSRSYGRPDDKNKAGFYVEHDWLLPFATLGFHFSGLEMGDFPALVNVWLKGAINREELEGRVFYKGQQVASTKDGDGSGAGIEEDRTAEYAEAFEQPGVWKRWRFQWRNFRIDNNGSFNRDYNRGAHYADKNPGEYAIKIYRNGAQIRELNFTVGADGKFVAPAYTKDIPLPYHTIVLPVKIMGAEKWDAASWKTEGFYGNPLTGFSVQ